MTSTFLLGGLGNQMFQIAAAKSLAISTNDDFGLNYSLCHTPNQGKKGTFYKNSIYKNIKEIPNNEMSCVLYDEKSFHFSPIPKRKNTVIRGYFQSEKYFIDHKNEVLNEFYFSNSDVDYLNKKFNTLNQECVSVQIRRGDYLKFSDFHPPCSTEYYEQAIKYFGRNKNFIFVSDDIKWVKDNFTGDNYLYFEEDNEILGLILLTICNHNIISNSSFGWWGAYLNKNSDKKIIAPSKWFGPKAKNNTKDLIPEKWKRI